MQSIKLLIQGALPADEVRRLLSGPDSGIELAEGFREESGLNVSSREPRRSAVGDVLVLAGIIVNIAQLSLTIYRIYQGQKKKSEGGSKPQPVPVQIITAKGTLIVPVATLAEIEESIKQHVVDDK